MMSPDQEQHLLSLQSECTWLMDQKYRKGQEEHGGNLFDMAPIDLLDNAINEAIDQVVYLITLRQKLKIGL
jgi:hypothetical protein